jgi:Domain of unknown function (DUF1330)
MPAYVIFDVEISDAARYQEFMSGVKPALEKAGAKYLYAAAPTRFLIRGGEFTPSVVCPESALEPKAAIAGVGRHFRVVPISDITPFIRSPRQRGRTRWVIFRGRASSRS